VSGYADFVENWFRSFGVTQKLGDFKFTKDDVPRLTDLAMEMGKRTGMLSFSPMPVDKETVSKLYLACF
jgi:alcohol dehydrogenase class IV